MIRLYEIIFFILFICFFPFIFLFPRVRNTVFRRLYLFAKVPEERESVWFHGASAGDILSLKPVIEYFYGRCRDKYNILITSNTESGRDVVKRYFPGDVRFAYLPFDIFFSVENFIRTYRPVMLFIEAAEFWPVLIHRSHKKNIKIVLINGNIKKEKLLFYRFLSCISSNPFGKYDLMILRNTESLESAKTLGVKSDRIFVSASTKYKNVLDMKNSDIPGDLKNRFQGSKRLVVFGSVHYEEEDDILYVVKRLLDNFQDIRIVIAPRHMERIEPFIKKLKMLDLKRKVSLSRFTEQRDDSEILFVDTIGDLFYIYSFASVSFVGGSLADRGGHNVLEPAVWGVPVITGRYVRNYEDIVKSLLGYGLLVVGGAEELADIISEILRDDERRNNLSSMLLLRISALKNDFANIESLLNERFSV